MQVKETTTINTYIIPSIHMFMYAPIPVPIPYYYQKCHYMCMVSSNLDFEKDTSILYKE